MAPTTGKCAIYEIYLYVFCFQVYKTQLERVSDGWHAKMSSFERLNSSLRSSLSELQAENNELKTMVNYFQILKISKVVKIIFKYSYRFTKILNGTNGLIYTTFCFLTPPIKYSRNNKGKTMP